MPKGPAGGPRPAASSHFSVHINFESFHVTSKDMVKFASNTSSVQSLRTLFEEDFNVQVGDMEIKPSGGRSIRVVTRTDSWMVYDDTSGGDIDSLVSFLEEEIGPVSSVQLRCL